jgi:hypothetical protein
MSSLIEHLADNLTPPICTTNGIFKSGRVTAVCPSIIGTNQCGREANNQCQHRANHGTITARGKKL